MKNVVGYVRVSTEEQVEGFSLSSQELQIKEYCERNNLNLIDIYRDEGISGKSITNRQGIQSMLRYILDRKNNIECVIVWKLNRLSRKNLDTLKIIEELNNHNISLISIQEGIDSQTVSGKLMVQMLGIVSEIERDNIVANVRVGMTQRAKSGLWNGNSVFGYDLVDKKLIINREEAKVIKLIYDMYVNENKGYKAITQYLNVNGYRTKKGNMWSIATVRDKLKNPLYAGLISWGKYQNYSSQRRRNPNKNPILTQGLHEPIISQELWNKAQQRMNSGMKVTKVYDNNFLLSGLLKCPMCGGSMVAFHRINKKTGQLYRYYECYNAKRKGTTACKHNLINADYAENNVIDRLNKVFNNPLVIEKLINNINKKNKKSTNNIVNELNEIDKKLKNIENKLSAIREYLLDGTFNKQEYNLEKQKYELQKEQLQNRKYELSRGIHDSNDVSVDIPKEAIIQAVKSYRDVFKNSSPEKIQLVLKSLIDKIVITIDSNSNERKIGTILLKLQLPGIQEALSNVKNFPSIYGTVHPLLT